MMTNLMFFLDTIYNIMIWIIIGNTVKFVFELSSIGKRGPNVRSQIIDMFLKLFSLSPKCKQSNVNKV